jgi:hypothetical protein
VTDDRNDGGPRSRGPLAPPPSLAPNRVTPEPAVALRPLPWQRAEAVEGEAELLVHATLDGGPPCAVLGRVDVREEPDAVELTLWVGRRPDADCRGPRPALAFPIVVAVALGAPLAGRALRDGALDVG